jgi:hypothetical protein
VFQILFPTSTNFYGIFLNFYLFVFSYFRPGVFLIQKSLPRGPTCQSLSPRRARPLARRFRMAATRPCPRRACTGQ